MPGGLSRIYQRVSYFPAGPDDTMVLNAPAVFRDFYPFFSVIICTRDRADVLSNALDSLLAQSEKDWEAIVVDDGSTDNTYDIVREYARRFPAIRYMFHANKGPALSRNTGLNAATGLFVTFLDSDDRYAPLHLETRKIALVENPGVQFLHGGAQILGEPFVPDKDNPDRLVHLKDCVIGGTFVIRRTLALALGGFPPLDYGDDSAFFAQARSRGVSIARIEDETYIYDRTRDDSICNRVSRGESAVAKGSHKKSEM